MPISKNYINIKTSSIKCDEAIKLLNTQFENIDSATQAINQNGFNEYLNWMMWYKKTRSRETKFTLLALAIEQKNLHMVQALLRLEAPVNLICYKTMGGINISCTPLALAVKTGNTAIVKALIDANARVNGMQNFSVSGGSSGSVDIDKNTTSQTLLEVAADNNLNEIVCLLLENGAKASAHGMTANEWFDGQKRCNRSEWVNDYPENDCKAALREAERKELTLQFKRELEEYSRNRESEGKHHHFTIRLNFFGNHKFNFGQYSKKEKLMAVSDINNLLDDGLANLSRDTLMQRMNPRILGALTQGRLGEIFNKYAYMPAFNDEEIAVEHGSKL